MNSCARISPTLASFCFVISIAYRPNKTTMSDRKAGAAAAGCGGVGVDHAERGADQVVDEIDLGASQKRHRCWIDQHHRIVALNHQVILGLRALDIELVLK